MTYWMILPTKFSVCSLIWFKLNPDSIFQKKKDPSQIQNFIKKSEWNLIKLIALRKALVMFDWIQFKINQTQLPKNGCIGLVLKKSVYKRQRARVCWKCVLVDWFRNRIRQFNMNKGSNWNKRIYPIRIADRSISTDAVHSNVIPILQSGCSRRHQYYPQNIRQKRTKLAV